MRLSRVLTVPVLAGAVVVSASCRDDPPATPVNPILPTGPTGTWRGSIVDSVSGQGTVVLSLRSFGLGSSGTWHAHFPEGDVTKSGAASGELFGDAFAAQLVLDAPVTCDTGAQDFESRRLVGTRAGSRITGHYFTVSCGRSITGTVDMIADP